MAKSNSVYVCQQCGGEFPKWSGQCANCNAWNSLVETEATRPAKGRAKRGGTGKITRLDQVEEAGERRRLEVGSSELAQVLGGSSTGSGPKGLVQGSVMLLAGEPGIGKSTLLSQLTLYFAAKHGKVLYVCGEEASEQVKLRLDRLSEYKKTSRAARENILLFPEVNIDEVVAAMEAERPVLTIVDSVQSMSTEDLSGMAGSVGQVRESGSRIIQTAKRRGLATFLVGHVTKEGSIAGPKVLEHMVDGVLNLSGERSGRLRILRALKNRFGAVDEVGVFEMSEAGVVDVANPSSLFLEERQAGVPGSCVCVVMEGTRPILVEIQALVVKSNLASPRRVAEGIKPSRLQVLAAVLEKRVGVRLHDQDVFVNVAGGIRVTEPGADLAICLAIASSAREKALVDKMVAIGEVGLLGEVRKVSYMDRREREAKKLGYAKVLGGQGKDLVGIIKQSVELGKINN